VNQQTIRLTANYRSQVIRPFWPLWHREHRLVSIAAVRNHHLQHVGEAAMMTLQGVAPVFLISGAS